MKTPCIVIILILILTIQPVLKANPIDSKDKELPSNEAVEKWLTNKNNSGFIENMGQMKDSNGNPVPNVLFKTEAQGLNFWITEKGVVIQTLVIIKEPKPLNELTESEIEKEKNTGKRKTNKTLQWERIDIELSGASIDRTKIIKENPYPGHNNFFYAHCPDGIYEVKEYGKITIQDVYPGIDWVFFRKSDGLLKHEFVVHPGADYKQIELIYRSKEPVIIDETGQLIMTTRHGNLKENTPVSYYKNEEILTSFDVKRSNDTDFMGETCYETIIKFNCQLSESYYNDKSSKLIIDPLLEWATFRGGNGVDGPMSISVDASGNIFIVGYTSSTNFPTENPGGGAYFQGVLTSIEAIFIWKFDINGGILWSTYYGCSGSAQGNNCAIDNVGNLLVTGATTSTTFPTYDPGGGAFFQASSTNNNSTAIVMKFNNNGVRLWATYFGGAAEDVGYSIAVDNLDNIFIAGETTSNAASFPLMNAGTFFQTVNNGSTDAFIAKFNSNGVLLWSTFIGGTASDEAHSITTDPFNNIFITGKASNNFPLLNSGAYFDNTLGGGTDAFISKFDNSGNMLWSTYYGGSNTDQGGTCITDVNGNLFVTGRTPSTDFPTLDPGGGAYYKGFLSGSNDVFLLKFDNLGNRLWATYYGGNGNDHFISYDNLAINYCGNICMSFSTNSTNLGAAVGCDGGYNNSSQTGIHNQYITVFDNNGVQLWSTYLGGDGNDFRAPVEFYDKYLFVSGEWTSVTNNATYPLTYPGGGAYFDNTFNGGYDDGFIVRLNFDVCYCNSTFTVTITSTNASCYGICDGTATGNTSGGTFPFTYAWDTSPVQTTQTATGLCAGTYTVTVTDAGSVTASATVTITEPPAVIVDLGPDTTFCSASSLVLDAGTGFASYIWSTSDITQTIIVTSSGTYSVTVNDSFGCEAYDTIVVTVLPSPIVDLGPDTSICVGDILTLDAGTGASYSWLPSGITQTIDVSTSGTYSVTVTDANGCQGTDEIIVTVVTQMDATITPAGPVCNNDPAFNLTSVDAGGTWSGNGITNTSNGTFDPSVAGTGTHTIIYTILAGSCGDSDTTDIVVNSLPVVDLGADTTFCSGYVLTLDAGLGASYSWLPSGSTQTIDVSTSGTYSVTVTDANGCQGTDAVTITVIDWQDASIVTEGPFCSTQTNTQFQSENTGGVWGGAGITTGGLFNPSVSGPGTFEITYTIPDPCGDSDTVLITVYESPQLQISHTDETCIGASDGTAELIVTGGVEPYEIVWSNGESEDSITGLVPGTYFALVTDLNGCSVSETFIIFGGIKVCYPPHVYVPNVFSPNGDGENDILFLRGEGFQYIEFIIYNRWGDKIFITNDINKGWDGTYKGKMCDPAIFTYIVNAIFTNGEKVVKSGNVTLVR